MNKPNLFIAGFPKCGSSALHKMISQHSEIYGDSFKEIQTYTVDRKYKDRFNPNFKFSYPNLYSQANGKKYLLDSSTSYSVNFKAIERIIHDTPEAKFIYILRDPLDRLISHYLWMCSLGFVEKEFKAEIESDLKNSYDYRIQYWGNYKNYVYHGNYSFHLQNLFPFVDRANVLIIDYQDLKHDYSTVVREIFDFLGLEQEAVKQIISNATKMGYNPKTRSWLQVAKYRASRLRDKLKGLPVSPRINHPLKKIVEVQLDQTGFLKDIMAEEIQKTQDLGISTDAWRSTHALANGEILTD